MNRIRLLAIGTMLVFGLAGGAQQTTATGSMPSVDAHLKMLTEKLDLTSEQQDRIRPMLKEMQDTTAKIEQDQTLSPEERHGRLLPVHVKADKELRTVLNEDQKKKLDQLEEESHFHPHESPNGAAPQNR